MATKGEQLATQFEAAKKQFITIVESMSDADWKKICPAEGWPVNVTAHHAAESIAGLTGLVQMLAEQGQVPPFTLDQINSGNAEHAVRAVNATKDEVLELARTGDEKAASYLRGLTDEQLAKTAALPLMGGATMSAEQLAEGLLVGHLAGHGQSLTVAS